MYKQFSDPAGVIYTFHHLKPLNESISVSVSGGRYLVPITVIFSQHCFTDGKKNTVQLTDPLYYATDHTGHRVFCNTRYTQSLNLRERMQDVIKNGSFCHHLSSADNYVHIHDPRLPNRFAGWYIMFKFSNTKANEMPGIKVNVTSYHYRQDKPQNLKWTTPYKFPAHVSTWLQKRPELLSQIPVESPVESEVVADISTEILQTAKLA